MERAILKISNDFSFGYGTNNLFSSKTDMLFEKGKIYGIYGSNGTGKSSLLNILNAFVVPSSGIIEYNFSNGKYLFSKKLNKITTNIISNNIRRCFQTPLLIDELGVLDNIIIGKRKHNEKFINSFHYTKEKKNEYINNLLEILKINPNDTADKLSYGQRRIIANLQILYTSPELILLDEPFSGLHSDAIQLFKNEYLTKVSSGATIILVEHLLTNLNDFANDYLLIKNKELRFNNNVGIS